MKAFRKAIRWWIFLPLAPILLAALSQYSAETFKYFGLHGLQRVAQLVSILDAFVLIPYMALSFVAFGWEVEGSFPMIILHLLVFGCLGCLVLYGVNLVAINLIARKRRRAERSQVA